MHVPFRMPRRPLNWLATKLSCRARMMGMPPPTLAPKYKFDPVSLTKENISSPCSAKRALFAVTTDFPARKARHTSSFAIPVPPINSTMMSISGSSINPNASVVRMSASTATPRSVSISRSAMVRSTGRMPMRAAMSSACVVRPSTTPAPTVPKPAKPMFALFITRYSSLICS